MSELHDRELADTLEAERAKVARKKGALKPPSKEYRPTREFTTLSRNALVLQAINAYMDEYGWPPSLREIGGMVGIGAPSVLAHLRVLEERGLIVRAADSPRALRVVGREYTPRVNGA